MKYIDVDLILKEIEKNSYEEQGFSSEDSEYGYRSCARDLLAFINSLQQEQSDFPTTDEQVKEFLATHPKIKVPEKYHNPDWLFKNQEPQEVDLEKEIDKTVSECTNGYNFAWDRFARHFYELGKLNARKEE